jgi:hypothetical protein
MTTSRSICALAFVAGTACLGPSAFAWQSTINGFGQGMVIERVWCHPNAPPHQPTESVTATNPPNATLSHLGGCHPLTSVQSFTQTVWRQRTTFRAVGGDTVDWHSMLPFVTPTTPDAQGFLNITAMVTSPNSATFTVVWSGSDAGVAMHIGWFENINGAEVLLHEEGPRVGPWSETLIISIVSTGQIGMVEVESSGAAVSTSCGSADFNCDGDIGTDADIAAFFNCLAGVCPPLPCTSNADFNGDGDIGTDDDIASFFSVLAGGGCI